MAAAQLGGETTDAFRIDPWAIGRLAPMEERIMKILITGSRGFVGGILGRMAARAGHELIGISLSSQSERDWVGKHLRSDVSCADLAPVIRELKPEAIFHAVGP